MREYNVEYVGNLYNAMTGYYVSETSKTTKIDIPIMEHGKVVNHRVEFFKTQLREVSND